MKKITIVCLVSILLLGFQGCGISDFDKQNYNIAYEEYTNFDEVDYYDKTNEFYIRGKNNIEISYPQIQDVKNETPEQSINNLIKDRALKHILNIIENQKVGKDSYVYAVYSTHVSLSTNDILSIYFMGDMKSNGGITDHMFNSITIDLNKATELDLLDFVTIDEEFAESLINSENIKTQEIDYLTEKGDVDSANNLKSEILSFITKGEDSTLNGFLKHYDNKFYVTPNTVVISVWVSHNLGDYALIEIPRK